MCGGVYYRRQDRIREYRAPDDPSLRVHTFPLLRLAGNTEYHIIVVEDIIQRRHTVQTINQYAVMVKDDTLPDYVKISREGNRTFLVSGLASSVEDLKKMFDEAARSMPAKPDGR